MNHVWKKTYGWFDSCERCQITFGAGWYANIPITENEFGCSQTEPDCDEIFAIRVCVKVMNE